MLRHMLPSRRLLRRIPGLNRSWRLFDRLIRKSIDIALDVHPKNLEREAQRRAMEQTVDYIEQKMRGIQSTADRFALLDRSLEAVKVRGLYLEFGVFWGTSINHVAAQIPELIYGFDSFEGLPEDWRDGLPQGYFRVPNLPEVRPNVRLIKGWFKDTLPMFLKGEPGNVAFLHVDCDLYSSTKTVLDLLTSRIVSGTVIVFDEYFNYPGWREDEFKAFHEFCQEGERRYEYLGYHRYGEQVAIRMK
jgi:hypothetical protein